MYEHGPSASLASCFLPFNRMSPEQFVCKKLLEPLTPSSCLSARITLYLLSQHETFDDFELHSVDAIHSIITVG
eukprot:6207652-Pleurochrysis_carterae.AAC.2